MKRMSWKAKMSKMNRTSQALLLPDRRGVPASHLELPTRRKSKARMSKEKCPKCHLYHKQAKPNLGTQVQAQVPREVLLFPHPPLHVYD